MATLPTGMNSGRCSKNTSTDGRPDFSNASRKLVMCCTSYPAAWSNWKSCAVSLCSPAMILLRSSRPDGNPNGMLAPAPRMRTIRRLIIVNEDCSVLDLDDLDDRGRRQLAAVPRNKDHLGVQRLFNAEIIHGVRYYMLADAERSEPRAVDDIDDADRLLPPAVHQHVRSVERRAF